MKYYPDLLLLFTLLSVTTMIKAQISIRPYSEWESLVATEALLAI